MRKALFVVIWFAVACSKAPPPAEPTPTVAPPTVAPAPDVAAPSPDVAAPTPDVAAPAPDVVAAPEVAAAPPTEPVAPPKPFADMTEVEQKDLMKKVVTPVMRKRFQEFDAEHFTKVNCATCHGQGAIEGKFEMPNAELPKLPKTPEAFQKLAADKPKAMAFMKDVVMPAMATMLGAKPYDPATHEGFSCMACHTSE